MRRSSFLGVASTALSILVIACTSTRDRDARSKVERAPLVGSVEAAKPARPTVALPAAPSASELAPLTKAPRLAMRAFALASRGKAPEARVLVARELAGFLASPARAEVAERSDAVVAALEWWSLARERDRWADTAEILGRMAPFPHDREPELSAVLDAMRAECLRELGRADDARAITKALGFVTDWRILGPFDNERGKGFATKLEPETAIDFAAKPQGKARAVAWRDNPCPEHPLGRIVLGEMLRPSTQGLAYLATAVRADADKECVLRLSTTGAFKVLVNGAEVLARKVSRPGFFDQDAVAIALRAGWNRVVVKSCTEDEPEWVVATRFTELDGRPLVLEVDPARAAGETPQAAKAKSKPAPSTRDDLAARASSDADAARLLALVHLVVHPDDRAAKSARKAIEKALATAKDDPDTLYLASLANAPEPGTSREEMEVNPWIAPLKELVARDASHVRARLDLARFAIDLNPTLARADALTAEALAAAPRDADAMLWRWRALYALDRNAEGTLLWRELRTSDEHAWTPPAVTRRAQELERAGDADGAIALLREGLSLACRPGEVLDALLDALADRGDARGIEAAIERVAAGAPSTTALFLRAAQKLELCGDPAGARSMLERARRIAPEDTDVLGSLVKLADRADDAKTADALIAEILRIDPGQDALRRRRELRARSGEERFETPYVWDARKVLAEVAREESAAPFTADEPLSVLDKESVYQVNRDGTSSQYQHLLWRVQNEGGVKALDVYGLAYPEGGTLSVLNVRILKPDGSAIPAPAPRRGDQDMPGGSVRVYDLPPLAIGDAVDVEYRVDESVPGVFGNYFGLRHEFYPDRPDPLAPTRRSELVVLHGSDVELYFHLREPDRIERTDSSAGGRNVHRFVARNLPRPKPESAMPRRSELVPAVDVTTYASWQAFASWWWSFIEKEFESSPAMKAKVAELTAGLTDEKDKIRALVRFVGQEIRYNSWPFGTHGYEPFSAPTIFERRFGDCKDKSILLCTMLGEIGVHAHPVLIEAEYARANEPLDAALVQHFNHCIAYAPATDAREGMYLDCTADLDPIEYLRADDQGARVLHVDDGKASLHDVPYAPPAENQLVRRYAVKLDDKGDGEVRLVDESNGNFGVGLRTNYGGEQGDIKKRLARDLRGAFAQVDVKEVHTSDLEDIGVPARLEARFAAKRVWSEEKGGASLRLALDGIGLEGVAVEPSGSRAHEIVLDRPFARDVTIRYELPSGATADALPPKVELSAPGLLAYVQEVRAIDGGVEVHRRFELQKRRVPLEEYSAFQDALRRVELAEQRTLRVATGPKEGGR